MGGAISQFQWLKTKYQRFKTATGACNCQLADDEATYIIYSLIANQKGQPLIQRWLGVRFIKEQLDSIDSLESVLDLTAINNENEYYSRHYLSAIFEGDLKDTFSEWQAIEDNYRETLKTDQQKADPFAEQRAPWIKLRSLV